MAQRLPSNANEFIEQQLDKRLLSIEKTMGADCVSLNGPLLHGVDNLLRVAVENRKAASKKKKLVVVLTTTGGYVEVAQRVAETFRHNYDTVDFVVPNYAYSAGTILAMSGDAIHMDYYSRLGPIDPQVENKSGRLVPALGYLEKYKALLERAKDPNDPISLAEVQLLIDGFDQAELYQFEQAQNLSVTLLKEWLVRYKFKDWDRTRTRGLAVTEEMKNDQAEEIARALNDTKRWHTHGRGISRDVLERDINLIINDLDTNEALNGKVKQYHDLLEDYMAKKADKGIVHIRQSYQPFM